MADRHHSIINTILYATDLGIYGPFLLEHVAELAKQHDASVIVVHAVEPLSPFADAVLEAYVPQSLRASLQSEGFEKVLTTIRKQVFNAFQDDCIEFEGGTAFIKDVRVLAGRAAEVILTEAHERHADLIVLGSKGSYIASNEGTMMGSVTAKVLQFSKIPVYMVPVA